MTQQKVVTLENLAQGAAAELFQDGLKRVLENALDVNTVAEKERRVTLTFKVMPSEDREEADAEIGMELRLAGTKGVKTHIYIGRHLGEPIAVENNPKQAGLFDETPRPAPDSNEAAGKGRVS